MKRQFVITIFILLTSSIFFYGCQQDRKLAGHLKYDNIILEESQHLFAEENKPQAKLRIDFSFIKESSDEKMKDSINHMLQGLVFGNKFATQDPQQAVRLYANNYFSNYRKDLEPMYRDESADIGGEPNDIWYSYEHETETKVEYYDKHLLTYRFYLEEFTGGAHPVYFTNFLNIDLRTLKQIELNDLLIGEYDEELTEMLITQLMEDTGASTKEELEELGYGTTADIIPTENFKLTPGGISFLYNIYEIAPYVIGPVEIDLSFRQLEPILNTEYMIVKELKN